MAHAASHDEHHGHHIIPMKILVQVISALFVLTVVTVLTAKYVDIGPFNIVLALFIAFFKAGLVVTFFMGLKWDNRVNLLVFSLGCIFVLVFISFTLFDTANRGDAGNVGEFPISDIERQEEQMRAREANNFVDPVQEEHHDDGHGDDGH